MCAMRQVSDPAAPDTTQTFGVSILVHLSTSALPANMSDDKNSQASGVDTRLSVLVVLVYMKYAFAENSSGTIVGSRNTCV